MIVTPGKLKTMIIDKRKRDHKKENFKTSFKEFRVTSQVKLLGVEIDNKLNFEQHINHLCKSAANQLNMFMTLKRFLDFQKRKVLENSFVLLNFNYCTHV